MTMRSVQQTEICITCMCKVILRKKSHVNIQRVLYHEHDGSLFPDRALLLNYFTKHTKMLKALCELKRQKELHTVPSTACGLGRMVLLFEDTSSLALHFELYDGENNGYRKLLKMLQTLLLVGPLRIHPKYVVLTLQRLFEFAVYNDMKLFPKRRSIRMRSPPFTRAKIYRQRRTRNARFEVFGTRADRQ